MDERAEEENAVDETASLLDENLAYLLKLFYTV
jgi:hypothetical protein